MSESDPPEASKERLAEAYFSARAAHYATSPAHADPESLEWFTDHAALGPDAVGIDVASGAGHSTVAMARRARSVLALDLSVPMLQQTRQLAQSQGLEGVHVAAADSHRLPVSDASLDFVCCRRAAHHFSNLSEALREFFRVLKAGGKLIIDDRTVPEDPIADALQQELDRLHDPSHVRQYSVREWRTYLNDRGFEELQIHEYHRDRPLTAFTKGAPGDNGDRIRELVAGLNEIECDKLTVKCHNGEYKTRHWYVVLSAKRRET